MDVREVICGRCNCVFYVATGMTRWHPQFCPFCGIRFEMATDSVTGELLVHYPRNMTPTAPQEGPPDVDQ